MTEVGLQSLSSCGLVFEHGLGEGSMDAGRSPTAAGGVLGEAMDKAGRSDGSEMCLTNRTERG